MKGPALGLALTMIFGGGAAPRAQEPAPDQSLERMRAVLQRRPLRMTPVEPEANFKIEIRAIHPMHDIFEKPAWQLDPIGWQPPGIGLDLSSVFRYLQKVKYEHDERVAREDVQRQIAEYCAAQPNANTIQICSAPRR